MLQIGSGRAFEHFAILIEERAVAGANELLGGGHVFDFAALMRANGAAGFVTAGGVGHDYPLGPDIDDLEAARLEQVFMLIQFQHPFGAGSAAIGRFGHPDAAQNEGAANDTGTLQELAP